MSEYEQLLHYRRCVADMYAAVRQSDLDAAAVCHQFRAARDHLFRSHPQSPLTAAQKAQFSGLRYFPYDPALRFVLPVEREVAPTVLDVPLQEDGVVRLRRFGWIHLTIAGQHVSLALFWVLGYGGGIFLPFRDATNQHETYGGGRYVLDTIKHADLGQIDERLVIDFNYAYNPSCAYNPRWICPLAPRENHVPVAIRAGELAFTG